MPVAFEALAGRWGRPYRGRFHPFILMFFAPQGRLSLHGWQIRSPKGSQSPKVRLKIFLEPPGSTARVSGTL